MDLEHFDRLLQTMPDLQQFYGGIIFSTTHLPPIEQRTERRFWAVFHDIGPPGHLTCLFRSSAGNLFYFDSCGVETFRDLAFVGLKLRYPSMNFNTIRFQSQRSCLCSAFCLIFVFYAIRFDDGARALRFLFDGSRGEPPDRRMLKNELIVTNWFSNIFGSALSNPRYQINSLMNC